MQSSLIPERPLVVSPTLAATIGLEEAVMLHVFSEVMAYSEGRWRDGLKWVRLEQSTLMETFPFWAWGDIRRVQKNLQQIGLIQVEAIDREQDAAMYAINQRQSKPSPPAAPAEEAPPRQQRSSGGAGHIPPDWRPDREWVEKCRQHNIPEDFIEEMIPGFVMYWRDRGQARFSWGNAFYKHVLRQWRQEQTRRSAQQQEAPMSAEWWPSEEAIQILVNAGVNRAFIEDAVPEFVLYWRERGTPHAAWNSRFIEHIRRQWARYSSAVENDGLPRPIPENWQPSPEVFDILRLAEIDEDYARSKLPEFVLYWRDTQQAHASWNTKFLQFIKYSWARHLDEARVRESGHAQNQSVTGGEQRGIEAAVRRFTDRSWAE